MRDASYRRSTPRSSNISMETFFLVWTSWDIYCAAGAFEKQRGASERTLLAIGVEEMHGLHCENVMDGVNAGGDEIKSRREDEKKLSQVLPTATGGINRGGGWFRAAKLRDSSCFRVLDDSVTIVLAQLSHNALNQG